jgi:hypothetical protein
VVLEPNGLSFAMSGVGTQWIVFCDSLVLDFVVFCCWVVFYFGVGLPHIYDAYFVVPYFA